MNACKIILLVLCISKCVLAFLPTPSTNLRNRRGNFNCVGQDVEASASDGEISSKEMNRLQRKIEEVTTAIAEVREYKRAEEETLKKLDAEFGEEVN